MIQLVRCSNCAISGTFDIEFKFRPEQRHCKSCGEDQSTYWTFNFCVLSCFSTWMKENDVLNDGVPCRDCINWDTGKSSGHSGGFKQNGTCKTCNGTMKCKGRLVAPASSL